MKAGDKVEVVLFVLESEAKRLVGEQVWQPAEIIGKDKNSEGWICKLIPITNDKLKGDLQSNHTSPADYVNGVVRYPRQIRALELN